MDSLLPLLAATLNAGTPLALAALGLAIHERAGVINLGAEGMMLLAAAAGFAAAFHTGSAAWGLAAGAGAGAALAAGFALLVVVFNASQYGSGLAIMLLGSGLSAFAGVSYAGRSLGPGQAGLPWLRDIPGLGSTVFALHPLVYATIALAFLLTGFLYRTRAGMLLRAVGESPESAHALGYPVGGIRALAILAGGLCCGLAGAYLSVVYTQLWSEGMVAGRGWMALALIAFGMWHPLRILLGAYLFGGLTMLQFQLQGMGVQVPSQFLAMLPYVCTIAVLALRGGNSGWMRRNMPRSLGRPFLPER
ncbi:ABC transporter permease [Pigmentiphaga sp.]|uniref:ABC transporter permease n=1 Tax=Pigmentiphaga sp. TaxID=1977564 RepID=UPI00128DE292|nr:ABC transporter permease [Pigmentiphaga sp.]MPS29372.1 ABC transporter permease [Alcaligenaceae bacterium SAGV5]MPS55400.1 ABC transporter permease [Alcaligenaceae bacterium SAGV3]MPT56669.1 ABC transporter permease [Alcaligenaceae bacterium]